MSKTKTQDSCTITNRKISSFLNNEVKDYAKYVIETRAIPNIMDGMRVGARKILWASLTGDLKNAKKLKMPALIGDVMKLHYNHGDVSLMNTIVQLASTHVNKYSPLFVIGQIGTLRIPKSDTAPRYLHVKKTEYIDFFKYDMELLEQHIEDDDKVEPKFFLPIIPISLIWRTSSPGFGFSYASFSYELSSIIDNCLLSITTGSCENSLIEIPLIPEVDGIKPENIIFNANKNAWYNIGTYSANFETDTLTITDLPYNVSVEDYDEHLQNLTDKNYITKFTDFSVDGNLKYVLNFPKNRLKLIYNADKWKFYQNLKLFSKIKKNTLNCIDLDGKTIINFDTPYQLIDGFVKRRLEFYQKRKTLTISHLRKEIAEITDKIKFIELYISGELKVHNVSIPEIKQQLVKLNLSAEFLKLSLEKLTKEEIEKIKSKKIELQTYLEYVLKTSIEEMYVRDLIDFKQKYIGISKII